MIRLNLRSHRFAAWIAFVVSGLWVSVVTSGSEAWAGDFHLPQPTIETLPNGLKLAWFVSDQLPLVDLTLMIKAGYKNDPAGKSGTAELLSNALDRGTSTMSAQAISKAIELLGAARARAVNDDSFTLGLHGLSQDTAALTELLAKLALEPAFNEADLTREHDRIQDEWRHVADSADSLSSLVYSRLVSSQTVYGRGGFLSADEFKHVTRADVLAYYQKYFRPDNAVLMIVGRVKPAELRSMIVARFGAWKGAALASDPTVGSVTAPVADKMTRTAGRRGGRQIRPQLAPSASVESSVSSVTAVYSDARIKAFIKPGHAILLVDRPDATQTQVRIGFRAPLITSPQHHALTVGNALTGEYFNSRLNSVVRDKLGLTYAINSGMTYAKDAAYFSVAAATRNEAVGKLLQTVQAILKDLQGGDVSDEEVQMAREYITGSFPLALSTLNAVASRWLGGESFGIGQDYLLEYVDRIRKVTREDVVRALKENFHPDDAYVVVVGDSTTILAGLSPAQKKLVKKIELKDIL